MSYPTVRAVTSAYGTGSSLDVTVPASAESGDFLILFVFGTNVPTFPDGWETVDDEQTFEAPGGLIARRYTAPGDAGSTVTIDFDGAGHAEAFIVAVAGPVVHMVTTTAFSPDESDATVTYQSLLVDSLAVCVGSALVSSSTVGVSSATADVHRAADTGVSGVVAHLQVARAVIPSVTFTPSPAATGYYYAVLAVGGQIADLGVQGTATLGVVEDSDATQGPLVGDPPTDADPFPPDPEPGPVPLSSGPLAMMRSSRAYNAPTLNTAGVPNDWEPASEVLEEWGTWRVYAGSTDVTMFRGAPTQFTYQLAEPFGCGPGTLIVPALRTFDTPGTGSLSWLKAGTNITIAQVLPGSTTTRGKWWGVIASQEPELDETGDNYRVALIGAAWLGDLQTHKVKTYLPPTDIGPVISTALNSVVSRRTPRIASVSTGIVTNQRGSSDQSELEYVQGLLATATTDDGTSQWTVGRASATSQALSIRLKDRTTMNWSVRAGQPGVTIHLSKDPTQSPGRIYGRGVNSDGYSWGNWVYPNARPDAAPAYPFSSSSSVITIGTDDGDTTSGDGVSTWQDRVNDLNLTADLHIDGVYNSNDAEACRVIQRHFGLTVDGIVGPQTWAATFDVGANGTDLGSAFRLPLAWDPKVMPRLYHADGSDAGANPAYDSTVIVVDRDENFGSGISKTQARRSARAELARDANPGWVGTITLTVDPPALSRWDVVEGTNVRVNGWHGANPLLHIAAVDVNPWDGSVVLTVDEKGRDFVTLAGILSRNRDSKDDPARLPTKKLRRSLLHSDSIVEYDGESAGGVIPRHALFAGLWTVIRVPVSQAGKVAKLTFTTKSPASRFCVAFFGDAVTPSDLVAHVGADPLAERGDGYGPFDWDVNTLLDMGFIEAFGGPSQAAGYDPGYETSPHTGTSTPVTGKLISNSSFEYRSVKPPWLWIAEYAPVSTFISGRILPGPVDY